MCLRDLQSLWTKRFAIALMLTSSNRLNCQNGLCSHGMQVRYFLLNTYQYVNMEVRQRTNTVKHDYVNVHHWEFDLSRPIIGSQIIFILSPFCKFSVFVKKSLIVYDYSSSFKFRWFSLEIQKMKKHSRN